MENLLFEEIIGTYELEKFYIVTIIVGILVLFLVVSLALEKKKIDYKQIILICFSIIAFLYSYYEYDKRESKKQEIKEYITNKNIIDNNYDKIARLVEFVKDGKLNYKYESIVFKIDKIPSCHYEFKNKLDLWKISNNIENFKENFDDKIKDKKLSIVELYELIGDTNTNFNKVNNENKKDYEDRIKDMVDEYISNNKSQQNMQ